MPSTDTPFLRLPGEDGRELWLKNDAGGWTRAAGDDGRKGGIYAIESLAMDSAPFWAVSPREAEPDLDVMSSLYWESLGVTPDALARNWLHWRVAAEGGRVLTATMALAPEAVQAEWASFLPEVFEPSARLRPIPAGECAVWRELGRLVAGFMHGDHLVHVAVLNSRVLDAEAALELQDIARALEVRGFIAELRGCRIWTRVEEGFEEALIPALGVKGRTESAPAPVLPRVPSGLLPALVAQKREEKLRHRDQLNLIAVISFAVLAFFGSWGGWLALRAYRVATAESLLKAKEPELQAVRQAQLRWYALEAAIDPDMYPVEVFHQIVSLLPTEGVQLQEFNFEGGQLAVSGLASSVNHALKFKADLENSEALKRYTWNFPQPTILDADNRASFRAEGALDGEVSHESE